MLCKAFRMCVRANLMIKIYDLVRVFGSTSPLAFIFLFLGPTLRLYWWRKFSSRLCSAAQFFSPFFLMKIAFILFNLNFHLQAEHSIILLLNEKLMKHGLYGGSKWISLPFNESWLRRNYRKTLFVLKLHKKNFFLCFTNTQILSKTQENVQNNHN